MRYTLYTLDNWIGLFAYVGVIIAMANTYIQSSRLWEYLGILAVLIGLYWLVKLILVMVRARRSQRRCSTQSSRREPQLAKNKGPHLELSPMAGFAPQRLPAPTSKKPQAVTSPSQNFARQDFTPSGLPPELFLQQ